jgi:hypothetical protein
LLLPRLRFIAFLPVVLLSACQPTCEATCEKLLSCDEVDTPLVALQDCTDACLTQERLYEQWEDGQKQTALTEYKTCVQESECSDIAEAVCYDEDIYAW